MNDPRLNSIHLAPDRRELFRFCANGFSILAATRRAISSKTTQQRSATLHGEQNNSYRRPSTTV